MSLCDLLFCKLCGSLRGLACITDANGKTECQCSGECINPKYAPEVEGDER